MRSHPLLSLILLSLGVLACEHPPAHAQQEPASAAPIQQAAAPPAAKAAPPVEQALPSREQLERTYVWLAGRKDLGALEPLEHRFAPPEGFARVEAAESSYQAYLRGLPLRTDRNSVKLYSGDDVWMPSAGVVPLDLGKRDLHQCADSIIRLYAEWLWVQGRAQEAQFHYTSGDLARWKDWRAGKILKIKGRKVVQVSAKKSPNTHSAYRAWLDRVFTYASTRSMHRDSTRITDPKELAAGDFFLMGGSPGHVVLLLDVAQSATGERVALVGQGYLPAREFHVIQGDEEHALDGVWFKLPSAQRTSLVTPTWKPFSVEDAYRFD